MPEFDADRAWRQMKATIAGKPSHSKKELLARMGELEVENTSEDGFSDQPPERRRPPRPATDRAREKRGGDGREESTPITDEEVSDGKQHHNGSPVGATA